MKLIWEYETEAEFREANPYARFLFVSDGTDPYCAILPRGMSVVEALEDFLAENGAACNVHPSELLRALHIREHLEPRVLQGPRPE